MRRFLALLLLPLSLGAQSADERTRWFREAKFGLFIHWGPYAVIGRHEWARHRLQIPQAEYDQYARAFNPVNFNADEWTGLAAAAGVKYIVITSKHHDGFSIYRSRASDYDMEITPFPGDPLKDLALSARRRNLPLGYYHSIMDWHHPDYRPRRAWEFPKDYKEGGNNRRYVDFMKEQIRELLTEYGPAAVLWFDGEWEHTLKELNAEDEVYDFIRQLSPDTLINDRIYERREGNRADFGTPEQFVPATGYKGPDGRDLLWESCVTINTDSWGYNKYETQFKTTRDLIRMLIDVVSKGGNLLLNVGPTPDGRIQPEFVTRLEAMGRWLSVNGEAIYGTTASPFARLPFFGRATVKGSTLYLHVFAWPAGGELRVPGLKNLVSGARLLGSTESVTVSRDGGDVILKLPASLPDETASVIALQLDGAPQVEPMLLKPAQDGALTLGVESGVIETKFGQRLKYENLLGHVFLTNWTRAEDVPSWNFTLPRAARYRVELVYAKGRNNPPVEFTIEAGAQKLAGKTQTTGGDLVFRAFPAGTLLLPAGEQTLKVRAAVSSGDAMQLEKVVLRPVR
jgi:alpha-L-fucosidase